MDTLSYYEANALSYIESTLYVDMKEIYGRFLPLIKQGGKILDFGCGSGRDSKYFIENGFKVTAIDGSKEMCNYASKYIGQNVKLMSFEKFNEENQYDGIWACASILHLEKMQLKEVLEKLYRALKNNGYIYLSFKYGEYEGIVGNRYFSYFTKDSFSLLMKDINGLLIYDTWISNDNRKEQSNELWLNIILRKG